MLCLTTKKKFQVDDPPVIVLRNGRFAYKCPCPWKGKHDKDLYAFKFCSKIAYAEFVKRNESSDSEDTVPEEGE